MNPTTLRRLALSASAIVATLVVTIVPAATFAADCEPISWTYPRDGSTLTTAAQVGGWVTGELDATGCDIGVLNPRGVTDANIHGAKYLGVVVDGKTADVKDSRIHHIGDLPIGTSDLHGMQRGEAIYYHNGARGTIAGNEVFKFQKNGIVARAGSDVLIKRNKVTGLGPVDYIAQNGIVILESSARIRRNTVRGMNYTPDGTEATGILQIDSAVTRSGNNFRHNEVNIEIDR